VTLRGRLTGSEVRNFASYRGGAYQVPVLKLEEDGITVEVFGPPEAARDFGALPVDDLIQVTGYNVAAKPQLIWLRSVSDFADAGRSGKSVMEMVRWGLAGIGILFVAGAGFIWALREKLKRQRSEAAMLKASEARILELNASLEHRVSERTNELAAANERLTRASEDALSHLARERELGDLKSNFVSMVSHEFRTPLAVILSSTELLTNHLDRLPPERRAQQLASIRGSTQQMARLIEEVLLLGKVEAGRMTFNPAPLNLRDLCGTLVDEALSATDQHCPVELTCAENLPEIVSADTSLLRHVFSNLLSNASKYSAPGTPVRFAAGAENGHLVFRVVDSGIGIPAGDVPRLFEPFHRARNVGSVSGTGLGLMIAKRCVDLHGGTIDILSNPGEGTTVTVRLPRTSSTSQP
jgi:signal transduction histidine kinase